MDRNEVLERLDAAGADRGPIEYELVHVSLLRAAAEIIRQSGWRPIAEAADIIPPGRLGWWGAEKWHEVVTQYPIPKLNASTLGYTYYFPLDKPAPPAREGSKTI